MKLKALLENDRYLPNILVHYSGPYPASLEDLNLKSKLVTNRHLERISKKFIKSKMLYFSA